MKKDMIKEIFHWHVACYLVGFFMICMGLILLDGLFDCYDEDKNFRIDTYVHVSTNEYDVRIDNLSIISNYKNLIENSKIKIVMSGLEFVDVNAYDVLFTLYSTDCCYNISSSGSYLSNPSYYDVNCVICTLLFSDDEVESDFVSNDVFLRKSGGAALMFWIRNKTSPIYKSQIVGKSIYYVQDDSWLFFNENEKSTKTTQVLACIVGIPSFFMLGLKLNNKNKKIKKQKIPVKKKPSKKGDKE